MTVGSSLETLLSIVFFWPTTLLSTLNINRYCQILEYEYHITTKLGSFIEIKTFGSPNSELN